MLSQWEFRFFGLTPESKEQVLLEPAFNLIYYMGFTWSEYMELPVTYKEWFLKRMLKEVTRSQNEGSGATRAMHHNDSQTRAMQGFVNPNAPARLRRFT